LAAGFAIAALLMHLTAPAIHASNIALTSSFWNPLCSTSPCATVSATQDGSSVDLTVTLGSDGQPYRFHGATDGNHWALAFDLSGTPNITVTELDGLNAFSLAAPQNGYPAAGFGTFEYAIQCSGCGKGYPGGVAGPMEIKITPSSGSLSVSSFVPNPSGHLFSVDIVNSDGSTGNVADPGSVNTQSTAPEIPTMIAVGFALAGFGVLTRRIL
jgi:hypothetical protein